MDADGGVYYRNSPRWADVRAVPGVGVYTGDRVQLICGAFGDAVGPYDNMAWSYVNNLSRGVGSGWVSEHFIDDGASANSFVAGEPMCAPANDGSSGGPGTGSSGSPAESVFYSGTSDPGGIPSLDYKVSDHDLGLGTWSSGGSCTAENVMKNTPTTVTTLAGWSRGRLGPIYYLLGTRSNKAAWMRVTNIILFDPGPKTDMAYPSCDARLNPSPATLLADWLGMSSSHHLLVITGPYTEARGWFGLGSPTYSGLWNYYFPDIWGKGFADRALVCDYSGLSHPDAVADFYYTVKYPPSGCPVSASAALPVAWNP